MLSFLSLFIFASEVPYDPDFGIKTPTAEGHKDVEITFTPGQRLNQEIVKLNRDDFIKTLGEETVKDLNIPFNDLTDLAKSSDEKRQIIFRIYRGMNRITSINTKDFKDLRERIINIKADFDYLDVHRVETVAKNYFSSIFKEDFKIECRAKTDGVQLGTRVFIRSLDGSFTRLYHVKTHSEGTISQKSSKAKIFDAKELLVYKFMELAKIGPEVHFLQRSLEDVYIATLDAGIDAITNENGKFCTFEQCLENTDFFGVLKNLDKRPIKDNKDALDAIEKKIRNDESAQKFIENISLLDVISRIFRLSDTISNSDNFGFSFFSKNILLKLIDFRLLNEDDFTIGNDHFKGFLAGNGQYRYSSLHEILRFTLHDRSQVLRAEMAYKMLTNLHLNDVINIAYENIVSYINNSVVFNEKQDVLLHDLAQYRNSVIANNEFLLNNLRLYLNLN